MATADQRRGLITASLALALVMTQIGALRLAPDAGFVRLALPATILAAALVLWRYRAHLGTWVMFVGLAANFSAIVANGGLMPIERSTVVASVGEERASKYIVGDWIHGSKDVLVAPGAGRLGALGDNIVVPLARGGFVASAGDMVVWSGLLILAAEASLRWQRRTRQYAGPIRSQDGRGADPRAEGGATH